MGEVFVLKGAGSAHEVKVESYPCTCRGLELPHEHYFIRWEGLEKGDKLEIKRSSSENNEYHLKYLNRE